MNIDSQTLPKHIAIIMDGNGRWAAKRGLERIVGHKAGVDRSEDIITSARDMGIPFLTLYAFSKENWDRPAPEVASLMELLTQFLLQKKTKMLANQIRLNAIGDLAKLPELVRGTLDQVISETAHGSAMVLTLALSYGARDEIIRALHKILGELQGRGKTPLISETSFGSYLDTAALPDPDLIIRTSGEHRLSNFLLWQGAYAEFVFEDCYWPDFTPEKFKEAICSYQKRERRFGKTSEQLNITT